ncbi:uncharacterized protein LOC129287269 [Prosopis cineraria]|uniref:uncharacterized protein LOC129287269 n=1 Tax=Prosopis cineraria TaxID=364024 RepID=UPI00240FE63B|nr:uncharacterized protein LOC129287269 [Prosopis cineraria]
MRDYLATIKSICDHLAMLDHRVDETDHISYVLNDLTVEYESVIAVINGAYGRFTLSKVHTMLIDAETHQKAFVHQSSIHVNVATSVPPSANDDFEKVYHVNYAPRATSTCGSCQPFPPFQNHSGMSRGQGRSLNLLICQICFKVGHTVDRCYYRFDYNYSTSSSSVASNPSAYNSVYSPIENFINGNYDSTFGYTIVPYVDPAGSTPSPTISGPPPIPISIPLPLPSISSPSPPSPASQSTPTISPGAQVYLATPITTHDDGWYLDFRATQHISRSPNKVYDVSSSYGIGSIEVDTDWGSSKEDRRFTSGYCT